MAQTRRVLALAVPAFATLVAHPLMTLADTWIVGRLGTQPLAGLGVGSVLVGTAVGLMIFLAYGSTATVSRQFGAGDTRRATELGLQAMWLAVGLGLALVAAGYASVDWLVAALGAEGDVAEQAAQYVRWVLPGVPATLAVFAATGTFRGFEDARTPLVLTVLAAVANFLLNLLLVFGLGLGIAGAGLGTAIAETGMGVTAAYLVGVRARRVGARVAPSAADMWLSLRVGLPLMLRTLSLRVALLLTTYVAAAQGAAALAAHHVVMQSWNFLANALDAIAIAGQTIIGIALGAGNRREAREFTTSMTRWACGVGLVLGLAVVAARGWLGELFSPDAEVYHLVTWVFLVVAVALPLAGYVFLLDGVLIGAGDGVYLAKAGLVTLALYAPLALAVLWLPAGRTGLTALWLAFSLGYMGARALTLGWRAHGDGWMRVGAE
ncbi:MATE family efflux transporter [Tessaracoccus sp. OH4464_COT-324]|uniref:MATE family efflux transporter n=1 Tax=Tessaracoccus sp. OH4464_COT-324 TaxID=2491059 RepID=UPI000F63AD9E|nr:MATE family efflux transporter [Tessaracoccus sp. OH4464_COT-324]RRD47303.1 MATE family efflux transporter [Tessaracoccus sp. OH4464_COT-324]